MSALPISRHSCCKTVLFLRACKYTFRAKVRCPHCRFRGIAAAKQHFFSAPLRYAFRAADFRCPKKLYLTIELVADDFLCATLVAVVIVCVIVGDVVEPFQSEYRREHKSDNDSDRSQELFRPIAHRLYFSEVSVNYSVVVIAACISLAAHISELRGVNAAAVGVSLLVYLSREVVEGLLEVFLERLYLVVVVSSDSRAESRSLSLDVSLLVG